MDVYLLMVAFLVGGYLLGSIPFGVLAAKLGGLGDIRKVGSGNIGATNVLRTGRKDLAFFTLIGDSGKGALAVLIARLVASNLSASAGIFAPAPLEDISLAGAPFHIVLVALAGGAAFAGHLFPVWLKFKGGKGVATFLGVLLAAAWPVGLLACATWLLMAFVFRISSLSALTAAALSPLYVFLLDRPHPYLILAAFMAVLVFIRHHENIRRLLKGEEPKIGKKKTAAA